MLRADFLPYDIWQTHIGFLHIQRAKTHGSTDDRSQDGRDRGTRAAERGEAKMPADEAVVETDIGDARCDIRGHGDPRIAAAALRRIEEHLDHAEEGAAHDDPEIGARGSMGIRIAPGDAENRFSPHDKNDAHGSADQERQQKGRHERLIRGFLVFLSFAARHKGRHSDIDREEGREADEFWLIGQAYRGHGVAPHGRNHHGVDHAGQRSEKALEHGRPGHIHRLTEHSTFLGACERSSACLICRSF